MCFFKTVQWDLLNHFWLSPKDCYFKMPGGALVKDVWTLAHHDQILIGEACA